MSYLGGAVDGAMMADLLEGKNSNLIYTYFLHLSFLTTVTNGLIYLIRPVLTQVVSMQQRCLLLISTIPSTLDRGGKVDG